MTAFDDDTGTPLDERLRRSIALWRARRGMSARRFGVGALGVPGFVGLQARGRPLRIDTADRVLAFMGYPPLGPLLRAEIEAFLAVSGTKVSILGEEAVGNPSFVGRLRRGVSPYLKTFDRVRAWMAAGATQEEARIIRERLANLSDPFDGTWDAAVEPGATGDVDELAEEKHLNTREAAAWLCIPRETLARCRARGEGPPFRRTGNRLRYLPEVIDAWARAQRWASLSEESSARRNKER